MGSFHLVLCQSKACASHEPAATAAGTLSYRFKFPESWFPPALLGPILWAGTSFGPRGREVKNIAYRSF